MRKRFFFVLWTLLLTVCACSSGAEDVGGHSYEKIPDACTLVDPAATRWMLGAGASPERPSAGAVPRGDGQSLCDWSLSTSGGMTVSLVERMHARSNGGITAAKKSLNFDRSFTCEGHRDRCRELSGVGNEAFLVGDDLITPKVKPAGYIQFRVREENVVVVIVYMRGGRRESEVSSASMIQNGTQLAKDVVKRIRASK
ncbi:hypothetical protein [Actinomadura roseirufa]|uniref:hypothetical protein n=1 Tax=Actinomadura roseirufa TaxID=2094049 RepID=UPI0010413F7D|nr:hypothetical protein [Actinomadura roseirufa]